jgi:nicotinamide-nucleotide amidase
LHQKIPVFKKDKSKKGNKMTNLTSMASAVAILLKERGDTVAVAESSTGGLVSAALLAVPGASNYFVGGGAVYTVKAREALLNLNMDDHPGLRASTEPYALLAAKLMQDQLGTVWGIAETGAAGPTGNRYGDEAGHTCIAVVGPSKFSTTLKTGKSDREENMWAFAEKTLQVFEDVLKGA